MKTQTVSTANLYGALRSRTQHLQAALTTAQQELASGRKADPARALGAAFGGNQHLRAQDGMLGTFADANAVTALRFEAAQHALGGLHSSVSSLQASLLSVPAGQNALAQSAAAARDVLIAGLNAQVKGTYLFGGTQTQKAPFAEGAANAARASAQAAFLAHFGIAPGDPAARTISATDMQSFLANEFTALFEPPVWTATGPGAAPDPAQVPIAPGQTIAAGISANDDAFARLAKGMSLLADLGLDALNESAAAAVRAAAGAAIGAGLDRLTELQSRMGLAQAHLTQTGERLNAQRDMIARTIESREGVDLYATQTWINTLMVQIEASYRLSASAHRLSLLQHI